VPMRGGGAAAGEQRGTPTAVAPRRAEPDRLALAHHDPQARVGPLQRVRGPQPGVAAAGDGNVGNDITRERHTRDTRPRGKGRVPQADPTGAGHARKYAPRMIRSETREHVVIITIDNPPVNALPVAGWFQLADALRSAGRDPATRVVILRAEGKGFQAGVDIKELAADPTHASLIGVNRGCYEAFGAVYDCEVPVIAAVQGFCVGGGIGLAGNADIVIASDDATFGLPEVDRGALGVATHLARFVPQHKLRAMFLTGSMITAAELLAFGTIERVVPRAELLDTALELAAVIAKKSPIVMRRAKESLNMIDPVDVKRSYRFEQGFTFELNLWGDSDELRQAFVDKRDADLD
jgi:enoyl-CoA hydratase